MNIECKKCQDTVCIYAGTDNVCYACDLYNPPLSITQGDRIRKMDNHELAKLFIRFDIHTNRAKAKHVISDYPTIDAAIDAEENWLNSPIEGEQK